jgi:hypothetical protein
MNNESHDAAALFAHNSKKGDSEGAGKTLSKLIVLGNIDDAAKALEGLTSNLPNALSQLTQPVSGIAQAFNQHPVSVLGSLKILGEQSQLNTQASASEITGSSPEGDNGTGSDGQTDNSNFDSSGGGNESHQDNDNDFFVSQSNYNPSEDHRLEEAGHKILGVSSPEHHESLGHSAASQPSTSSTHHEQDHHTHSAG